MLKNVWHRLKTEDGGFSLVELIVVIAIIGSLTGGAAYGMSMLFSRDAERCATSINDALNDTRMYSMSKANEYTATIKESEPVNPLNPSGTLRDVNVCEISSTDGTTEKIYLDGKEKTKKTDITLEFKDANGTTHTPALTLPIMVKFDKQKGSVCSIEDGSGVSIAEDGILYFRVSAKRGASNRNKQVVLITATGKHWIEEY